MSAIYWKLVFSYWSLVLDFLGLHNVIWILDRHMLKTQNLAQRCYLILSFRKSKNLMSTFLIFLLKPLFLVTRQDKNCNVTYNLYMWITGLQGKREGISLTPHYHFYPLHRYLDISRPITAESSPLHIASSLIRTENLWFPSEVVNPKARSPWASFINRMRAQSKFYSSNRFILKTKSFSFLKRS